MSKPLRKQTGKSTSGSVVGKQERCGVLPPELVRMIKYASCLGGGYVMFKVKTGKAVASKTTNTTEHAALRKIPGIPLITTLELCALATRLGYGSPASSVGVKSTRKK